MNFFDQVLQMEPFWQVRANHALEHATLHLLEPHASGRRMAGFSDAGGFWLFADLPPDQVLQSASEALQRLQAGESELANHQKCGTNMIVPAFTAGSLAWLAMAGAGRGFFKKLRRLPLVIMMVLLGYELGKPLSPLVQSKVTAPELAPQLEIINGLYYKLAGLTIHRIRTRTKRF